jgi:23S rRNA (cytosine1962-C5)-methyltransferase
MQVTTAGMDAFEADLLEILQELLPVNAIQLVNDTRMRGLEQLPLVRRWALGVAPDAIQVRENNLDFLVPLGVEQKTGWFFDHRVSRRELRHWVKDARVLDLYSFLGAFGLNAAAAGAASVLAIDSSALAVDAANANAALQKVTDRFTSIKGDVVDVLRELFEAGDRFDVVVVDPPAFVKRKKDLEAGRRHYALVNRLAMRLLTEGGIVLSASCSQAFSRDDLRNTLRQAAPKASSGLHILGSLEQGPDHPALAAMPETHYLKGFVAQLLK